MEVRHGGREERRKVEENDVDFLSAKSAPSVIHLNVNAHIA